MPNNLGNKKTMAKNIKYYMDKNGVSAVDMCRVLQVPQSTFSYWMNARSYPRIDKIEKMANYFGVKKSDLVEEHSTQETQSRHTVSREIDPIYDALNDAGQKELCRYGRYLGTQEEYKAEEKPKIISFGTIPHFLTAAAAGYVAPIEGQDFELIERDENTPAGADFCIDIDGDSMEPYIHDGQRVYVKRDTTDLHEFEVGIFYVDGDVLCKQWCRDYIGTLHLLSANPLREDANRQIPRSSGSTVICFGKVLLPRRLPRPEYRR